MREMGIEAIYPKPNLSKNANQHPVYPYLLRNVVARYPNHIWGTDITYIRMKQGFLYLTAFLDWYSRYVLSWRLSTMLTTDFVLDAAHERCPWEHRRLPTVTRESNLPVKNICLFGIPKQHKSVWMAEVARWTTYLQNDSGEV